MTGEILVRRGVVSTAQCDALAGLLAVEAPGDGLLPPLWHWTQLLETPAQSSLGPDGHPLAGIPVPPGTGRKRMFAGGRVRTHRLLRTGVSAERTTTLIDEATKQGRSGPLTFVTIQHTYTQGGEVCIVEENDIVYRDGGSTLQAQEGSLDLTGPQADGPSILIIADETFLFRFSALTYNAHRIHYDAGWARHEGYPGLVVHGPLQAMLMGELHRRFGDGLVGREFGFRLQSPIVGTQPVTAIPGPDGLEHGSRVLDAFGNATAGATITSLQ